MTRPQPSSFLVRDKRVKHATKASNRVAPQPLERSEQEKRWLEENRAALDAYNRRVEEHGLPLAKYRRF